MAGVRLTYQQILKAARRLPAEQRKTLVQELASEPSRAEALKVAGRLRPAFRLPPKKQKRLSLLLQKGNAGKLTPAESKELDALVEEVEAKMLEFAEAVDAELENKSPPKGRNGLAGRR
jgi:hypothetical protein